MRPQSAHKKGKRLEQWVITQLEEAGLGKALRTPGSGSGKIKSDIFSNTDFTIECKNEKQWHWKNIDQAIKEAEIGNAYKDKWALVCRDPRYPEFQRVYAVIDIFQFLELLKKEKEPLIKEPDRQTAWHIKNAIQSLKQLLKDLE